MQVCVARGQSPSQTPRADSSQAMGSHSQTAVVPMNVAVQTVSGGHSPLQTGNGVWSHGTIGGSQWHSSRLSM
jgi:hypothetical protein